MSSATLRSQVLREANDLYRFRLSGSTLNAILKFSSSQSSNIDEQLLAAQTVLQLMATSIKGNRKDLQPADVEAAVSEFQRRQGDAAIQYATVQCVPLEKYPLVVYDPLSTVYIDLTSHQQQGKNEGNRASVAASTTMETPPPLGPLRRVFALRQRYFYAMAQCLRSRLYVLGGHGSDTRRGGGSGGGSGGVEPGQYPLLPMKSLEGFNSQRYIAVLGMLSVRSGVTSTGSGSGAGAEEDVTKIATSGEEAIGTNALQWLLEDDAMQIELETQDAVASSCGIFAAGAIVVARGYWTGGKFIVKEFAFPPGESRTKSLSTLGSLDSFGLRPPDYDRAFRMEQRTQNAVIIVLAHVHLDRPETISKLQQFFSRLSGSNASDLTFVLVGDFSSKPLHIGDPSHHDEAASPLAQYKGLFDDLGLLLSTTAPGLASGSQFIFVPGPFDLTSCGRTMPQYPISSRILNGFSQRCPKTTLAPNPCRLRFGTFETVVARVDSQRLWRKPRVARPMQTTNDGTVFQRFDHVVRTIVEQSSVAPCLGCGGGAEEVETLWPYDHALRLFPLPDTVILCDSSEQWETHGGDTVFVNPGTFHLESTFVWLTPADRDRPVVVNRL